MDDDLQNLDLKLTLYSRDLESQNRQLLRFADWNNVDLEAENRDLATVTKIDNLSQAILNRLYTRKGELASLGHPDYGSRLYLLVGELNNIKTQGLANIYIRECLHQESRIDEIIDIVFEPPSRLKDPNTLKAKIIVKVVDLDTPLTLNISIVGN
ncbi:MAG: DUF2634 domain-containing protein [Microcoleus anatoxicus]|uniref:DUF2634 domain-containing protein n=1 Tax=Microcoleus anatoxicus TaxID=2705319 RepID=UPI00366AC56D